MASRIPLAILSTVLFGLLFDPISPPVSLACDQKSPTESLQTLHPAPGVEVSLWASEPMVNNPTAIEVDSRGRVWITEGLNYRMKQIQHKTLSRVPNADRIKVLSDTDGDGTADTVTVFADGIFPVPLGMAVEEIWKDGKQTGTRVYIGNSPDLLVFEDTDGDDKADRSYALLSGFRGVDSDHGLHGMTFGPDGKLYFTVGDGRWGADRVQAGDATLDVTDASGHRVTSSNFGTTLSVNRDGTELEILSSGHRNNYEVSLDSFGNVFGSDNDDDGERGCRMYWVIPGGEYGYQHPESSRHWAEEVPGVVPKLVGTGNGSPSGLTVYEGNLLPEQYRGSVLQIDAGTHQINAHRLRRHGAGFRSDYKVLLKGDDTWFRPVDLSTAPDGSLFVCDWYDAGVGANRFSDQTTGRIYRISASASPTASAPSAATKTGTPSAIDNLRSPNATTRLTARKTLLSLDAASRDPLLAMLKNGNSVERSRALHVLRDLPDTGIDDTLAVLSDGEPRLRETAIRLLTRSGASRADNDLSHSQAPMAPRILQQILPLASDPDAGVRRALMIALRDTPTTDAGNALTEMAQSWDGQDRYYLESLRSALKDREPDFLRQIFDPMATRAIASQWSDAPIANPPYYPIGSNDAFLRPDDRLAPSNAASRIVGLAWVLQRPEALPALTQLLDANQSVSVERAAIAALSEIKSPDAGRLLLSRLSAEGVNNDCKQEILRRLGLGVKKSWNVLATDSILKQSFVAALGDKSLQSDAIDAIAIGKLPGFEDSLLQLGQDEGSAPLVRAAAIRSLGALRHIPVKKLAVQQIELAREKRSGGPIAVASLNALGAWGGPDTDELLGRFLVDTETPLDIRRRALQILIRTMPGVDSVFSIRESKKFPTDLENELSFLLHNHADGNIRKRALAELPIASRNTGSKIHNVSTVLALQGDASRGKELFSNHPEAACARCHRVTGEGTLVGPDLASIGRKYGDKEMLYHIQFPSGAINFSFVAHSFLMDDGRLISGLVLEREDGQIKLGVTTGEQISITADEVEEERPQSLSLMPEGLVANLTAQELADLVEYLLTLRLGDAVEDPAGLHIGDPQSSR